jgi:hypothetical protein
MRGLAVMAASVLLALAGCADPYATPTADERTPAESYGRDSGPLASSGAQDAPDSGDRREAERNRRRPAFAHLPYLGDGIAVDYVEERAGRLVLLVLYRGRRAHARDAYRRFLARYRDSGRAYLAVFQPAVTP